MSLGFWLPCSSGVLSFRDGVTKALYLAVPTAALKGSVWRGDVGVSCLSEAVHTPLMGIITYLDYLYNSLLGHLQSITSSCSLEKTAFKGRWMTI